MTRRAGAPERFPGSRVSRRETNAVIRMLGRYELLEQVGSGGMAVVYRGRDTALDREVAVKLLHPHLASAPESRARFSREARAVARLSHPGIVEIYDYAGDAAVESYLVTEFIRGRTLRVYAAEVGFGWPELAILFGRSLADALVHAHSAGVIHRDLKPENVLVHEGDPPAVKLADFGIARILASEERMTMTGALVGSPHHMAPEIVEGRDADARSDVFSLGTILYWLATGRLPFAASNPTAILRRVLEGDFDDPRLPEPRVPDALAALVTRCLQVDPAERPASAAEIRDALDRLLADVGVERPGEELLAFLRDPPAYKAAFPARAVAALSRHADAALAAGQSARALADYNRILAFDPENGEVPRKLARLARRRRVRRLAAWTGGAVAALALVGAAAAVLLRPRGDGAPPPDGGAAPVMTPATAGASPREPAPRPAPEPPPVEPPAPRLPAVAPRPETVPTPSAHPSDSHARAVLSVHVRPYAQRALLDGVEVARGEQTVRFDLGPGPHVIQIEHACCVPYVKQVTADEAARQGEIRIPLEPRPARLRVEGDPATRVYVEGRLLGTAGESQRASFSVPVPDGGESPYEASAKIVMEPPGGGVARQVAIRLRAGAEFVVAGPAAEEAP
jgi:eukaryotic-like serine/threonine-protein kinase